MYKRQHPLSLTLFLKEGCKQCTEAVRLRDIHQTLVLRHRKEGEVEHRTVPVSYTHLDVYKRQDKHG